MKIYTKTGDQGKTSLLSGKRVSKADPRLEAYGTVDELNSVLGLAVANLQILKSQPNFSAYAEELMGWLKMLQNQLFTVGSHLACDDEKWREKLPPLNPEFVVRMESVIDTCQAHLPELKNFILPGGSRIAALLHLARTVCRRAERASVELGLDGPLAPITPSLNRMSDLLFVLARYANFREGFSDQVWEK